MIFLKPILIKKMEEPKFFHYLNRQGEKNLLDTIKSRTEDDIIVCQQLETRRYAYFKNYAELSKYIRSLPQEKCCFYEILTPDRPRKPYFDIDMYKSKLDRVKLIKDLKKVILLNKSIELLMRVPFEKQ